MRTHRPTLLVQGYRHQESTLLQRFNIGTSATILRLPMTTHPAFGPHLMAHLARLRGGHLVVVCCSGAPASIIGAYLVARLLRSPLVVMIHHVDESILGALRGESNQLQWKLATRAMQSSLGILTLENGTNLEQLRDVLPKVRTASVPSGVSHGTKSAEPPRPDARIYETEGLFVGSLDNRKGVTFLPEIWRRVVDKLPHARLTIIGSGRPAIRKTLLDCIAALKLTRNIRLVGWVDEPTKRAYYLNARIFISTSLNEGFGLAMADALLQGVPVIAWDLRQYSHFGGSILRVKLGDVDTFASEIVNLCGDPMAWTSRSANGIRFAQSNLSIDKAVQAEERALSAFVEACP